MTTRNLQALFAPTSIAVVGASDRVGSVGFVIAQNVMTSGFAGPVMLMNKRPQQIGDQSTVQDVAGLPHAPDLAIIATPPKTAPGLIAQLGARGCRAAIVITAGFGPRDGILRQALLQQARPHLLRVVGPNCLGVQSPASHINASFAHLQPAVGKIALVSQSGAILASMLDWAAARGVGFSRVVSLGDMTDVDFGDMLDFLALDTETDAILLYIENVTNARKFMSAGRIAARTKPVIVVKAGRSEAGARAAATHTGALAGQDLVYDAAFRRAGMLRIDELGDLFDATEMLASGVNVTGDQLTILTNGGGAGVLAVDELEALDGRLARLSQAAMEGLNAALPGNWSHANPIDIIGDARDDRYAAAMKILLAQNAQDAILAINCPTGVADGAASAAALTEVAKASKTPLLTCWLGEATARTAREIFQTCKIPTFETPAKAVRAFMQLATYQRNQAQLLETPNASNGPARNREAARSIIVAALDEGRFMLTEPEAKDVLRAYGLSTVDTLVAQTGDEAAAHAEVIGKPVALKIYSRDISHKSDIGGVALNLRPADVATEARAMQARVAALAPTARLEGFVVEPMVDTSKATELLVGIHIDQTFGAIVLFGAGGVATELLADRAVALAPLNAALAGDLINRTSVAKQLAGYRNVPAANRSEVEMALVALSDLAVDVPEIAGLDINPLLASDKGAIALDARIALRRAPEHSALAIAPYPTAMSRQQAVGDATLLLRPIRPEDESALVDMASRCAPDDLRFRFHGATQSLTHQMAARLSQIDYDREMAFIAIDGETIVGAIHLLFDPNIEHGQFAILVRTDWQGRGVGAALIRTLLDYAQSRRATSLSGEALVQNTQMIALARALGAMSADLSDGTVLLRFQLRGT